MLQGFRRALWAIMAGTLHASFAYERQAQRLPPLNTERLAFMSRRRVDAAEGKSADKIERSRIATKEAERALRRYDTELDAFKNIVTARKDGLRLARERLLHASMSEPMLVEKDRSSSRRRPHTSSGVEPIGPRVAQEAVREVTRDCVRRDELAKRKTAAMKAAELAQYREEELEMQRQEQQARRVVKIREEEAWLKRKMELEGSRLNHIGNERSIKAELQKALQQAKEKHEKRIAEERASHLAAKDTIRELRRKRAEKLEEEREALLEMRRKEKAQLESARLAQKAEERARKAMGVWHEAEAVAERCRQEYEAEAAMVRVLRMDRKAALAAERQSQPTVETDEDGAKSEATTDEALPTAQEMNLERLRRRLEREELKARTSKRAYEEHTAIARNGGVPVKKREE